jgi:type III restriction enzyme
MPLKTYQENAIETLRSYLLELNEFGPKRAFMYMTERPYKSEFFGEVPFICVKFPTGGGKTLVGCRSVREIFDLHLKNKMGKGIVMWFVPSEAIKSQTLRGLKDRNDLLRKSLEEYFENKIRIFSNEEALKIRKSDVENNLCIIVSSLEAFRKEKKIQNKYKVYQENGELLSHFEHLGEINDLEKDDGGTIINSLANVIKISNPLMVIDEGHKTKTKLSIDFINDLNPSFIIEYTATPRPESNILISVTSAELKAEHMVKIPIILESVSQWQQAINRGYLKRVDLEKVAKKNKDEYIRPIVLLQAEQEKEDDKKVTVGQIKDFLMKELKVPEEEIAIKTSKSNELEGVNLFSQKCKIRYIITVSALAEGWDCSFAYILISVANIGAKVAVEQIIGRIMRLPNVKKKKQEDLNYSYVFASARNFKEAANQIIKGLEDNGYSKSDIINVSDKKKKYDFDVSKVVKEDLAVPIMAYEDDKLEFADLIGEDFKLSKQDTHFEFETHWDSDGRYKIDISEEDKWIGERQTILHIAYKDKNFSKEELILWLDKKLRFIMLNKSDKMKFIENVVDYLLNKHSLSELSVNRFVLKDKLKDIINEILVNYAKERFDKFIKKKKIVVKPFEKFEDQITLSDKIGETFKKNFYEDIDKLNKEELAFVQRLDSEALPNIKFWARSREKKDPFYLQGWRKNKFYPDFIAVTKKGNILALEWKGKDRVSNEDTQYKVKLAEEWTKLDKKLHFFLVHVDNIEEVLNEIKEL